MNIKEIKKQIKRDIPSLFIALKKNETPLLAKILSAVTVAYILSPIDLIPDFIPVLGYIDDLIILPLLVGLTIKLIPDEIFKQCRIESENLIEDGKKKKWFYAIPILLIWVLPIYTIIKILK